LHPRKSCLDLRIILAVGLTLHMKSVKYFLCGFLSFMRFYVVLVSCVFRKYFF